ncbi:MAG: hypothetical protein AAF846_11190 [Chloroflexota bacterium]
MSTTSNKRFVFAKMQDLHKKIEEIEQQKDDLLQKGTGNFVEFHLLNISLSIYQDELEELNKQYQLIGG